VRLFTAIEIPASWRDEAARLRRRLASDFEAELRFVAAEQLHVTVRFLGDVPDDRAAGLPATIEAIPPLTPTLTLEAAGTFGRAGRPHVVWLGVAIGSDDATELLREVDRAIAAAGLVPPEAPWRPHLTLARVRRQVGAERRESLAEVVERLPVPPPHSTASTTVALYRSDLGNRAPIHKLLARSAVS
jgi:2'-5' RNA ligase